jgi:hypothetical protein
VHDSHIVTNGDPFDKSVAWYNGLCMGKKLGLVVGGVVIAGSLAILLSDRMSRESKVRETGSSRVAEEEVIAPSAKTKEYLDASGFSFSYPDDLTIEKKDEPDKTTYSLLELQSDDISGLISIHVADSTSASVDAILKKNKDLTGTSVKKVRLAGLDARQYTLNDQMITLALDTGVLFTLTAHMQENKPYWQQAYSKIIESFAFTPTPVGDTSVAPDSGGEEEVIFEGEEIVE